jgi:secreted PhoX family phosphatase
MSKDFSLMEDSNRSSNLSIHDVSDPARRQVLRGGLGALASSFLAPLSAIGGAAALTGCASLGMGSAAKIGFKSVAISTADVISVPEGYVAHVIAPWGDPVGIAGQNHPFKDDASNTAAEQEAQIGMHHDGIHYYALEGSKRGLLAMNHEYVDHGLLFKDGMANWSAEKVRKSQAAHGVAVVEVHDKGGKWEVVNPRANNTQGNIIRWKEDNDFHAVTFAWNHFILAGDASLARAEAKGNIKGDMFSCPDGLWVDGRGLMWIQTDMSTSNMGKGDLKNFGNNMMLAADVQTGEVRRFLVGPAGCEITGVTETPDGRTMFLNVQHPGEPSNERTNPANPTAISNWPDKKATGRPRSATVVVRKLDGGIIGT